MFLALLFLTALVPNVQRLGDDDWRVREAETARCSNAISASLLPVRSDDAEVNYRIQHIRRKALREFDPVYVENVIYRDDFKRWVRLYVMNDRSYRNPYDIFLDLHSCPFKADQFFEVMPCRHGYTGWMRGSIAAGEWEKFQDHLDRYRFPIPMPRSK